MTTEQKPPPATGCLAPFFFLILLILSSIGAISSVFWVFQTAIPYASTKVDNYILNAQYRQRDREEEVEEEYQEFTDDWPRKVRIPTRRPRY